MPTGEASSHFPNTCQPAKIFLSFLMAIVKFLVNIAPNVAKIVI